MRPSHLVIDGGEPPLLKITVWLGNKAADKYRLAPLFGRADAGKIPPRASMGFAQSPVSGDTPQRPRIASPGIISAKSRLALRTKGFDSFAEILRASPGGRVPCAVPAL